MPRIRVLHVCNQLDLGGTEKTLQIFCKYLDKSRFEVFACGRLKGGVRVEELKSLGVQVFVGPLDLDALANDLNIDICHVHRSGHHDPGSLPRKRKGVPRVVETNVFQDYDPVENPLIDGHCFVSRFSKDLYLKRFPQVGGARYEVLYNPVDFEEFPKREKMFNFTIGRCGRPDMQKWHDANVEALPRIFEEIPQASGVFQGAPDHLRNRIISLGLQERVTLLQPSVQVADFYGRVDVFTHASRVGETFGCVIAEAMANGIPVVTLSTPQRRKANAQAELVEHNVTGLVCRHAREYPTAVIELLRNDDLRTRFGRHGMEKARDQFEASRLTQRLENLYMDLMDTAPAKTDIVNDSDDLPRPTYSQWALVLSFAPEAVEFLLRHPTKLHELRQNWRDYVGRWGHSLSR